MKKVWFILPLLLTLIVTYKTFPLRLISYDKIPAPGVTFDEYAFAWMGKSLLQTGMPVSWTTNLSVYKQHYFNGNVRGWGLNVDNIDPSWNNLSQISKPGISAITFDYGLRDRNIDLVQPYFDHPPLAGIIYSLGIPKNMPALTDVSPIDFRRANAFIGVVTALLIFVLGWLLYSPWVGLFASSLYSTVPATLLSSRLTLAENIIIPLFLISMICLQFALRYRKLWLFILSGLFAGSCALAKFSGISTAVAGLLILFLSKSNRSQYLGFSLAFLFPIASYLTYTNLLSPELFWRVMANQSSRGNWGVINLIQSIQRINFSGFPIDGWWTGGLICLFYLMNNKRNLHLSVMGLSYLLVATLLGGDNNAWYFFPLGIFACLAWGVVIEEIIRTPNFINLSVFFLFGTMSSLYWGYIRINSQTNFSWTIRIGAAILIASGLLLPKLSEKHKVVKYLWVIFMIFVIHRLYLWNFRGFQYILSQWGRLPPPLMLP